MRSFWWNKNKDPETQNLIKNVSKVLLYKCSTSYVSSFDTDIKEDAAKNIGYTIL